MARVKFHNCMTLSGNSNNLRSNGNYTEGTDPISLLIDEDKELILDGVFSAQTAAVDTETQNGAAAPNVRTILKFAIPAVGVWLCSPLLSLIDTCAVGLCAGTAQQAALNPAVAVTEYTALLIVSR